MARAQTLRGASCCFLLLMAAGNAAAGLLFGDDREYLTAMDHNSYRVWQVEDTETGETFTARQFVTRFQTSFALGENIDAVIHSYGGLTQHRASNNATLDGPGDLKVKAFYYGWLDRLVLSAGVSLPTGSTELSEAELRAASVVSPHALGFRMKNHGEGLGFDLGAALGFDVGNGLSLGGGLSFLTRGEYDFDEVSAYDPADEISLTVGGDLRRDAFEFSADLVFRSFGTDVIDNADSFDEGNQIELSFALDTQREQWGVHASLRDVIKDDNEVLLAVPVGSDTRVPNGNNLWLSIVPRYRAHPRWEMQAFFDYTAIDQSQQQSTSSWARAVGIGSEVRLTPVAIAAVRVAKLSGASEDDRIDLSGFDTSFSLRWQY